MRAGNETLLMFLHALSECHALAPSTTVQAITSLLRQITPTTSSPAAQVRAVAASADTDYDTCGFANGKPGLPVLCTGRSTFCGTGNTDMDYYFFGCCTGAVTIGTYSPYGCGFSTSCEPYTDRSEYTRYTSDGITFGVTQCADANYPHCLLFTYPAQEMQQWVCSDSSTTSSVTMKVQYYFPETTGSSSMETFSLTSSSIANVTSTNATTGGGATISDSAESSGSVSAREPQFLDKNRVIGGVLGGVGAAILAVVALIFLRRQRKPKSRKDTPAESSFTVLGSNVHVPSRQIQPEKPIDQPPTPPFPGVVEADASGVSAIQRTDDRSKYTYEPYRPPSVLNPSVPHTSYYDSRISTNPNPGQFSPYQPCYLDGPDIRPIAEVHGSSSFISVATPTLPDPPSRKDPILSPVELEGSVRMSTQSGPIPEWT